MKGGQSSARVNVDSIPQDTTDIASQLPGNVQRRNVVYYVIQTALIYFCAPILYVDFVQTTLCDKLGASKTVANLPSSAAKFMAVAALILVWLVPHTRWVKTMVACAYTLSALIAAILATMLVLSENTTLLIAGTVVYGGICGMSLVVAATYMWEVVARGVSEGSRGLLFSLSFGFGPILAILGSAGAHFVLQDKFEWLSFPRDYALLFATSVPMLLIAAIIATGFQLSYAHEVVRRDPFVTFVLGGVWDFLRDRRFLFVTISYVLMFSAWWVMNNATLHIEDTLGVEPTKMAGLCSGLRFGGKVACGLVLGWVYARFAGRTAMIATSMLTSTAIIWALTMPGNLYLGTFALFGGGELAGVYYYTYIVSSSPANLVKRNTSLLSIAGALIAVAPWGLGAVADHYGIPASMWIALGLAFAAMAILFAVPARPQEEGG